MGRAPCCEKMGMKKGPWTPQEDQILVSYVQTFGHGNWRALPKQAGLLRCGKSCRLRWMNYLRPDIKRGNFTKEEEEIIIKMHQVLGNRWSTIAAKLPGRTDNEIKNVWHTHLKKRLHHNTNNNTSNSITHHQYNHKCVQDEYLSESIDVSKKEFESENASDSPMSRQYSTITDLSTTMVSSDNYYVPELPSEDFWTQVLSSDVTSLTPINESGFELSSQSSVNRASDYDAAATTHGLGDGDERDFWCNFMSKAGEFPELLEM